MPNIYDNRRANLIALVSQHNDPKTNRGGMFLVAKTADIAHPSLSTIISGAPKSAKDHKSPYKAHMGESMARKIESAFMFEAGSFDLPKGALPVGSLTRSQKRLLQAIENRMKLGVINSEDSEVELSKLESLYPVHLDDPDGDTAHQMIFGTTSCSSTSFHQNRD